MNSNNTRTTVAISQATKTKLDKWRANGQCYDGFLTEMVSLWEKAHIGRKPDSSKTGK